jgi:hypothetical protein
LQPVGNDKGVWGYINSPEMSQADARRIVACWNACDGVETELLDVSGAGILARSAIKTSDLHEQLQATRKLMQDLLDAAKRLEARAFFAASTCADKPTNADMLSMLQAIAKAEGGAA